MEELYKSLEKRNTAQIKTIIYESLSSVWKYHRYIVYDKIALET